MATQPLLRTLTLTLFWPQSRGVSSSFLTFTIWTKIGTFDVIANENIQITSTIESENQVKLSQSHTNLSYFALIPYHRNQY